MTVAAVLLSLLLAGGASAKWIRISVNSLAWLHSVYFIDDQQGWVVGSQGTYLTTRDGGENWQRAGSFTRDNIRDVYFSDRRSGWLLCERSVYSDSNRPPSYLLRTHDGGNTWTAVELQNSRDRLVRFIFIKDGRGFLIGEGGAIWQILDDEESWKRIKLPSKFLFLGGAFADGLTAVLVGGAGTILFSTDGGMEWNPAIVPLAVSSRLSSSFFVDQKAGWAVGAGGKILFTDNGGRSWTEKISGVSEDLSDVVFADQKYGVIVGDKGRILETTSGGATWESYDAGVNVPIDKIFLRGKKGLAVGFGGLVLTRRAS